MARKNAHDNAMKETENHITRNKSTSTFVNKRMLVTI